MKEDRIKCLGVGKVKSKHSARDDDVDWLKQKMALATGNLRPQAQKAWEGPQVPQEHSNIVVETNIVVPHLMAIGGERP